MSNVVYMNEWRDRYQKRFALEGTWYPVAKTW